MKSIKKFIVVIAVFFAALFVSQNFYQLNLLQGDSMYPTYKNMQFTIIDKRASDFQNGDVIVFYCPALDCTMVKRIIATSGDTVLISEGTVFVNGSKSPHITQTVTYSGTAAQELLVGEHQFFVIGDNYARSKDSRSAEIGCINRDNIIGRLIPNRPVITISQ